MTVFGGDTIYAADINDRTPRVYTKPSATSRNTTTTYAADPDLQNIPLDVGFYQIELSGFFTQSTTTTQKIKTRWIFSGTWSNPVRSCIGPATDNTDAPSSASDMTVSGYNCDSQDATYNTYTGGAYTVFREMVLNLEVTVAGNLSLHWAQSVSSGNNTTLQIGTGFVVRKLLS